MVQRRAARWTLSDYARTTSVTSLQSQLNSGRPLKRDNLWSVSASSTKLKMAWWPCSFLTTCRSHIYRISRYCHSMTFRQIHTGKDYYKYSFFPLNEWPPSQYCSCSKSWSSKQQLDNCSIPNPRQYTAYFNMILIVLDPPLSSVLSTVFINVFTDCFYSCLISI